MSHYKHYPAYKDSGVEWLGDVPEHWQVAQYKHLVDIQNGSDYKHVEMEEGFPVIGSGGAFAFASDYLYDGESVLLGRKGTIDKPRYVTGKFWTVDTMYWTKIAPDAHGKYTYYTALTIPFNYYSTNTALPSMTKDALSSHAIARPPLHEQMVISAFLDRETTRIDALIAKKTRFIELLREKRQAVITRAVTKGLDPNVKMKDSGVEWLGDVPAHWEVKAIKRESLVQRGASPRPIDDPVYFDDRGEYAWVRISDVTASEMYLYETEQRLSSLGSSLSVKMQSGSLFLSIAGSVGKPCIAGIKCCIHDGFVYFPGLKKDPKFLFYIFVSGQPYSGLGKMGTQLNLNTDTVASIYIASPPIEEQFGITIFLDRETAKIDSLITRAEQSVALLRERRSALITAAVTGRIDIRQVLPELVD
ncbi:restriction endonuclease subunit S [Acidithiobacillus sp.]|jgi:type I restriction enzyme S subunit|uniref:restriction endonuclease subunit S n=1 Tax=Acidithiobacillus sp. TaxID=1872118 RepID=UPI0025C61546|nr:restriction endonuclease subunit S [Acidithiobacillus sp.]MCK9189487.1 restriction endonuclease subunit S [Acidithiobacillus sp.]MCK9359236.1 restriction endonuclease subunit S [Acidithiobacillus sp.]